MYSTSAQNEAASNTAAKSAGPDDQRPDKEKLERARPKNETAINTGSNDSRPVLPRGSVAAMTTRSVAVQTEDSYCTLCVRHEYQYCDVCVNRSDDNMLDDCFQVSQRLTSDPTTTPQQCHKEIDNAANRADQRSARHTCP